MIFPTTEINFEVQPLIQELNMEGSLFFIERIVVEADTNGTDVTVLVDGDGVTITAGTVNTGARGYVELFVQRAAPIRGIRLQADFTTDIQLFGVEVHVRPVELGIQRFGNGQRITYDGKMIDPQVELTFDVDPARTELEGAVDVPILQFLNLEINTDGNDISPVIDTEFGPLLLQPASTTTRETVVYEIQEVANAQFVRLQGDWTNNVQLYRCELVYGNLDLGIRLCEVN